MITNTTRFTVRFPSLVPPKAKRALGSTFYDRAKKHIVKGKRGGPSDLSKRVDEVAYGL